MRRLYHHVCNAAPNGPRREKSPCRFRRTFRLLIKRAAGSTNSRPLAIFGFPGRSSLCAGLPTPHMDLTEGLLRHPLEFVGDLRSTVGGSVRRPATAAADPIRPPHLSVVTRLAVRGSPDPARGSDRRSPPSPPGVRGRPAVHGGWLGQETGHSGSDFAEAISALPGDYSPPISFNIRVTLSSCF